MFVLFEKEKALIGINANNKWGQETRLGNLGEKK